MARVARAIVYLVAGVLILLGLAVVVIETGWAKNRLRSLLVRQANEYLVATLAIARLEGSLFRGIQLSDIDLSRDGRSLIHIDEIALSYSLRDLFQSGTVIRRVQLTRPRVFAARLPDGRWDLGALIKREQREERRTGPGRPIEVQSIDIADGLVVLRDPLDWGPAHLPTEFASLDASFSFVYQPVRWRLTFERLSWIGRRPELTVTHLSGSFGLGPGGWVFDRLVVKTPRSAFQLDGRVIHSDAPTELDLAVHAERFAFQEWSGLLPGLRNIAVDASFDTSLKGPLARLETALRLDGTGGSVRGNLKLDTTVPGWRGAGGLEVGRLDLSRWLARPDRPSDITGHVSFDLALGLGRHFPRGTYAFNGAHAMFMGYAADQLIARGHIDSTTVRIAAASATAYGARVTAAAGSIGLDDPFRYRFQGSVKAIDLRNVPPTIPVPRVESEMTFAYDVSGRFSDPVITGQALFDRSTFLGAVIMPGTTGSFDNAQQPLRFTGDGEVSGMSVARLGQGLEVGWMQEPRYAGIVSGRFRVDGSGSNRETLVLSVGGRVTRAEIFHGTLDDGDVSLWIADGSLRASYSGRFAEVDPAVPFDNPRFAGSLSGSGTVSADIRDLLTRSTTLADYEIGGSLAIESSTLGGIPFRQGAVSASLTRSTLTITELRADGDAIAGRAAGTLSEERSDFQYEVSRADLAALEPITAHHLSGSASTTGRVSGPWSALRTTGDANLERLDAYDVQALTLGGHYDLTVPSGSLAKAAVRIEGRGSFFTVLSQPIRDVSGTITFEQERAGFDLRLAEGARSAHLTGSALVRPDDRVAELVDLSIAFGNVPWRLARESGATRIAWSDAGFTVTPLTFLAGSGDRPAAGDQLEERIEISGDWRSDGQGALHVKASHVFLDTLQTAFERPARFGGLVDLDATIRGTRQRPLVAGTIAVTSGRVERVSYQRLAGRFDYDDRQFSVDLRLDQSPGVSITAVGLVPLSLFDRGLPAGRLDVSLKSSGIGLGLLEGVTDTVRHVSGELHVDVKAVGTSDDPRFLGSVAIARAAFQVTATGSTYKNARAAITLTEDRVTVEALHVEDAGGRPLEVHGSLGTQSLRVSDLEITAEAAGFEIFHNEFGRMEIDARLHGQGRFQSPRVTGDITIHSGNLNADEILARTAFEPYATEPAAPGEGDPFTALNRSLWDLLGMDLTLHVPNSLRLTGENVQVSPGTPIGIGNVNLRVAGDLYFYKDPGEQLYVTGSLDSISGTYSFQGRRFDVSPNSSIVFRGDLNPELYLGVTRVISGVEVRVGVIGPVRQPELRLASTPPLDASEILSLIVFNTQTNQLTAAQQQDLVVRAGTLAAGFVATPLVSALESKVGLEILDIEPGDYLAQAPKVTVGEEIAPGLVARFSRQFGSEPYDEATVEYYLARILRLRATFSDAQSYNARSPFRRVERAGIDLLFFFSF